MNLTRKHGYSALVLGTLLIIFAAVLLKFSFLDNSIADAYICGGIFAAGILFIFVGHALITRDRSK